MTGPETLTRNPEEGPLPYEPIALELSEGDINTAMELYLDFTRLPDEERKRIHHFDPARPRTGTSGYEHKGLFSADGKPYQDNKHVFHFTPELEEPFMNDLLNFKDLNLPMETRNFLSASQEVYYSLAESTKQKYTELEENFPALVGMHFPKDGKLAHHLRFLAYQPGNDGMLARGHYDKGSGTIAVAESHGGLRIGLGEHDIKPLDRDQHDPVFFPAYGWHQLAQMLDVDTDKKAAWHDVIDTCEQLEEGITRWAMVYFVDPANIYLESTKEQTHTPIPWRGARATQALHNIDFLNS